VTARPAPLSNAGPATNGWLQPLAFWPAAVLAAVERGETVVRVLVATLRGSAPQAPGACMIVGRDSLIGTVGGGHLEWQALQRARELLDAGPAAVLERRILGIELGQCCGGVVELWLERWTPGEAPLLQRLIADSSDGLLVTQLQEGHVTRYLQKHFMSDASTAETPTSKPGDSGVRLEKFADSLRLIERLTHPLPSVWLFGAGHVGQALATIMDSLPFATTWLDAREGVFPPDPPARLQIRHQDPVSAVAFAPAGARYVILTHDHALDYRLVRHILDRGDAAFIGLIGSDSKAARFRSRLAHDGYSPQQVRRLTCPIGVAGIHSKLPAAIAVAVAAQLLQTLQTDPSDLDIKTMHNLDPSCSPEQCSSCGKNP